MGRINVATFFSGAHIHTQSEHTLEPKRRKIETDEKDKNPISLIIFSLSHNLRFFFTFILPKCNDAMCFFNVVV